MAASINLDISKRVDITCRKGDSFRIQLTFTDSNGDPMPVTNHFFKMSVKETDTSSGDILAFDDFTYDVTGENVLTVECTYTTMETVESGIYVYDLQSKDNDANLVRTWIYGVFKINEDVSV